MKILNAILLFLIISGFTTNIQTETNEQFELKVIERYTNSYQNKNPKGDVYLVLGFSDEYRDHFFDSSNTCILSIVKDGKTDIKINKSELFKNPKNKLWEYYYLVTKAGKVESAELFDLYLVSNDYTSFSHVKFDEKDKKKIIKAYKIPAADASQKEKLEYYKKTGDRQGQLMGQAKIIEIYKRMKCSAKKRKFRKEGINGAKEMIYGM